MYVFSGVLYLNEWLSSWTQFFCRFNEYVDRYNYPSFEFCNVYGGYSISCETCYKLGISLNFQTILLVWFHT